MDENVSVQSCSSVRRNFQSGDFLVMKCRLFYEIPEQFKNSAKKGDARPSVGDDCVPPVEESHERSNRRMYECGLD